MLVDGTPLPAKVLIPDIEPRDSVLLDHDITFDASGLHEVELQLEDDVLREDNSRFSGRRRHRNAIRPHC